MRWVVGAIIQARTGSTRLPGKVLAPLNGVPMLEILVRRLQTSRVIERFVVATTTEPGDEAIVRLCDRLGIEHFRGSEKDVLGRVCAAASHFNIDIQVECTGDNPLVDGRFIDPVLQDFLNCNDADSSRVCLGLGPGGLPPGLNFGIYSSNALESLSAFCLDKWELREHVGSNFRRFQHSFDVYTPEIPKDLQYDELGVQLTVDHAEDQLLVAEILRLSEERWGHSHPDYHQISQLLQLYPNVAKMNSHVSRK